MACLQFKKFCFCLDLRRGCYIIAFVTLVCEVILLILNSFVAKHITDVYNEKKILKINIDGIIYSYKFLNFLHMLLICFKILFSIALLVGLFKRLPDHLEMWYKGYLLSIFVQAAIVVCAAVKSTTPEIYYWLLPLRFVITIVTVYFIIMVRSYYFQMCKEANYYQNIIYTQTSGKGHMSFSDRPIKNTEDSIYETIPSQQNVVKPDMEPPKYGFLKKAGGEVYSAPNSALVMPMPVLSEAKDKQSSMLYPSLV